MKKFFLSLSIFFAAVFLLSFLAWMNRENLLAHFISKNMNVQVTLGSLEIDREGASLGLFWMGNPKGSKTKTSFAAAHSRIDSNLDSLFSNPIVIDQIEIDHIFVGIEFYDDKGSKSNWDQILQKESSSTKGTDYLIKTLILKDLTVEVTQANGRVKRYPTLAKMEFHNISSQSGFPVDEIQKAIFQLMMKNLFQSLPIDQLFKNYVPSWIAI